MVTVKKAFAWLFGNFLSTVTFCWIPLVALEHYSSDENPDEWDYGIVIFTCFIFAFLLISDLVVYRKKAREK